MRSVVAKESVESNFFFTKEMVYDTKHNHYYYLFTPKGNPLAAGNLSMSTAYSYL
jgi:hypothetical protein